MSKLKALSIAVLASVSMLPLVAVAQEKDKNAGSFDISDAPPASTEAPAPQSQAVSITDLTVGVASVSQKSAVFGRYNGLDGDGAGFAGGWNVQRRDASDSGQTHYLSFTGDNIDFGVAKTLPEASINLKVGEQGRWWVSGSYDAMTYTASNNFTSILDRDGNLSPGYAAALQANGAYLTNSPTPNLIGSTFYGTYKLSASTGITSTAGSHVALYGPQNELTFDIGTRRDKGAVAGGVQLGQWAITTGLSHEHKEGSLEQTMTTAGSNAGMVAFPMPVNYDTDIFSLGAAYNTHKLQVSFGYELSNFKDNNGGYAFEGYNFTSVKTTTPTTSYTSYPLQGVYSLPPSNQAHSFTAQLGYNATPTTRLNATFVYGLQLQNDAFPAATANAYTLAATPQLASNPGSLNGVVQTFFGSASVTSRPLPKLDLKASYTIDARDPQTSAMWIYGDPTDALDNNKNIKYREAVPESWTKQNLSVSGGYHLLSNTRVSVGYTFRDAERANAITHHTEDNEESVKLQSTFAKLPLGLDSGTASLSYLHADRTASAPDYSLWLVQISSDCGATLAALGCQQVPFYEAARTQDSVTGMFTAMKGKKTSFSVYAKWNDDEYHSANAIYNGTVNPSVGINRDYSIQVAPDIAYQIDKVSDVHLFYTYMRTYRSMRALNDGNNPAGGYYAEASTYDLHTAGISGKRQINAKLKIGAQYVYSYGAQGYAQSGAWSLDQGQAYGGDPQLNTRSSNNQVKVFAHYDYSPNLSMHLNYRFDSLDTTDWALVGATVGQILTGDLPPKYNVHTVMAALTLKF